MLKSEKYSHPLSQSNFTQLNDEEGGLNLGQVGAVLRRRLLLIGGTTALVATAAVLKAETDPPIYQGTFDILTKPVTGEDKVTANVPQSISSQDKVAPPESTKEVQTTIAVLQSPKVLNPIVEKLQEQYPGITYDLLVYYLTISSKKPNIISIEYQNSDQQLVTDVLKLLADAYLQYSLQERQSDVEVAIQFVDRQKQPLEKSLKYWQEQLRNLRLDNNLIEPAQKAQELSGQLTVFRQQRIENRVQLEQMIAKYEDLQRELAQEPGERAGNSLLSDNARYQKILDQIQAADIAIKQQSAVFTDENPAMITLKQKKESLLPLLAQEEARVQKDFQSRIQELSARDRSLDEKINNIYSEIRKLATISRNYDNIQRELQIANEALTQFTSKQQALQIEKAQKQQPWVLLDPQLSKVNEPLAISDSAKKNLALGGLLGLILGVGTALVVDKLSNIFYSSQELKDATRLPLLGIVPLRKELEAGTKDGLSRGGQNTEGSSFFEVFRSLYTNILLLGSDTPIRSLVISSAGQGDGKSTIATQLAQAAAAMGQRVLLVDANLRAPSLHNRVGLMNIQGLTDVISQDLDWHNVIEPSPQEDNMFVMPAGPIPPDSMRLLASQKMQNLMEELQVSFDLVIYDTPPLLGFGDAYLLAANTDGLVLVAGLGKLKRTALQQALEQIQISGTPLLGMIANKSKDAAPVSYQYYQQYYRQSMSGEKVSVEKVSTSANSANVSSNINKANRS
ncbi:polysaccharide biosynthesis tyrosine autokinase [Tolypothrix sp. LEGE 11397]|uniref:GumC family protein n=1 Tax=unclassified Tolypothrix TaxID=2649714 RepID=UPI000B5DBA8E|nr:MULTISPECIES: polysaccharide biosynthesis tyrosine autokinase [unclassified Tolypothrix]MBE9082711.1 polysaccharide biosynthesis tyrosine autokinase [Tolypothrix sp. LEGE 11397]UYD25930.1 polysaccharide biosynthesis tyrosine autokinase [Tolypothrix sp. PCC 7712]UYD31831.1 polysaccharide biosynthesis tyrosine autokinase [Tolypothrix sp. PCC 7601]BAY91931.1 capsular exopolysaccharide family protein [Microchaete diplosiphon NIES-3275]